MMSGRLLLAALLLLAACKDNPRAQAPLPDQPDQPEQPEQPEQPAVSQDDAQTDDPFAPTFFADRSVEAILEMDRRAGGKRLQATWLITDDESLVVSYRPEPDYYPYVGKRVIVIGKPYTHSPNVQSVGGTHFVITNIILAQGELPYDPPPTELPPAPRVASVAALQAYQGRWVELHGTLEAWTPAPVGKTLGAATIKVPDGSIEAITHNVTEVERGAEPATWIGQAVTLTTFISEDEDRKRPALGRGYMCAGDVPGCGVEQPR